MIEMNKAVHYWWYLLVVTTWERMKWESKYIRQVGRDGFE